MHAFQRVQARLPSEDRRELLSALQYYRLGLEADTSESRLVNLWIALESLCRRVGGTSIIDRVCEYVVPGVTLNNLRRIVESVARYIQMIWKVAIEDNHGGLAALKPYFPRSSESLVDPADVLDALLAPRDTPADDALYGVIGHHELVRNRVSRLQENVFNSAANAAKDVRRHSLHVDWQIRRIYRARNQVMHQGRRADRLENLIRHLQTYLVLIFHNLVYDLDTNPEWTIPDAMQFRVFLCNQLQKRLSDAALPFPRAAILDPAIVLTDTIPRLASRAFPTRRNPDELSDRA